MTQELTSQKVFSPNNSQSSTQRNLCYVLLQKTVFDLTTCRWLTRLSMPGDLNQLTVRMSWSLRPAPDN